MDWVKIRTHDVPNPGDVVTMVEFGPEGFTVDFEDAGEFYAKHLFAHPRRLMKYALKIMWINFKRRLHGQPKVDRYERVADVR